MKRAKSATSIVLATICITACSSQQPPLDANGKSPEQVMMETYVSIVDGDLGAAQKNFSDEFIQEFITSKNTTLAEYCQNTNGWKIDWLRTELVGNDYNDNLWRVKIIPDEGKGKDNGPGIVQDLYLIDGVWKIVFWNHYPKS